jgi:hypothetical protein
MRGLQMKNSTKRIAYSAMLSAVSVLLLYISSVAPTMRLGLVAMAGVLPAVIVIRFGVPTAFASYAAVSILALILLPDKLTAVLYIVLFGHYPMFKNLIERLRRMWLEWLLKLALFNVLAALLFLLNALFLQLPLTGNIPGLNLPVGVIYIGLAAAGNAAFVVYDIGFSGLIAIIIKRFSKF